MQRSRQRSSSFPAKKPFSQLSVIVHPVSTEPSDQANSIHRHQHHNHSPSQHPTALSKLLRRESCSYSAHRSLPRDISSNQLLVLHNRQLHRPPQRRTSHRPNSGTGRSSLPEPAQSPPIALKQPAKHLAGDKERRSHRQADNRDCLSAGRSSYPPWYENPPPLDCCPFHSTLHSQLQ